MEDAERDGTNLLTLQFLILERQLGMSQLLNYMSLLSCQVPFSQ